MVELSEVGLKEEEVELDLVLSIGGSFRRPEEQPVSKLNGFELNLKEQINQASNEKPEAVAFMYPRTKREIQALRRLEARKKHEEKQQNKRVVRETEPDFQQRFCKREKTDHHDGGSEYPNVNLNLNGGEKQLGASCVAVGSTVSFQQQPYAYVQLNNGYAYPCIVKERNAGQPVAGCKGFRPFAGNGYGSDLNGERDSVDNKKAKSDGSSTMCSSSVVSDHPSSSHEGGGSSDSQSQSVQSSSEPNNQLNRSMRSPLPEQTTSSQPTKSDHTIVQQNTKQTDPKTESESGKKEEPMKKPPSTPLCSAKPPRPQPHLPHLLTKMPYVSTTGNGPNGKQVNGFLYRYNNSEVSIVCVCHGSTFTPAGFVQHAGSTTDISHPERQITVINPPAFG